MKRALQTVLLCSFVCATAFGQRAMEGIGVNAPVDDGARKVQHPEGVHPDYTVAG